MQRHFIIFAITLLTLCSGGSHAVAQPYNTNAIVGQLADTNNYDVYPTDPIADSLTVTNYSGSFTSTVTIASSGQPISYTNFTSKSSFTLFQNSHFQIIDQWGTVWKSGTNGVLSIAQTNGTTLLASNGNLTITSNGIPSGIITAAILKGTITNLGPASFVATNAPGNGQTLRYTNGNYYWGN